MFTGLKTQHELTDFFINDIVPHDHDLVKLKKVLNWGGINRVYESCVRRLHFSQFGSSHHREWAQQSPVDQAAEVT